MAPGDVSAAKALLEAAVAGRLPDDVVAALVRLLDDRGERVPIELYCAIARTRGISARAVMHAAATGRLFDVLDLPARFSAETR